MLIYYIVLIFRMSRLRFLLLSEINLLKELRLFNRSVHNSKNLKDKLSRYQLLLLDIRKTKAT